MAEEGDYVTKENLRQTISRPLGLATVCFIFDLVATYHEGKSSLTALMALMKANSYFDITLFSIAAFDLLQQVFYLIPRGIRKDKAVLLAKVTLVYFGIYVAYLFMQDVLLCNVFLLVCDAVFLFILFRSYKIDDVGNKRSKIFSA